MTVGAGHGDPCPQSSTQVAKSGGSGVQGHPWLHSNTRLAWAIKISYLKKKIGKSTFFYSFKNITKNDFIFISLSFM